MLVMGVISECFPYPSSSAALHADWKSPASVTRSVNFVCWKNRRTFSRMNPVPATAGIFFSLS